MTRAFTARELGLTKKDVERLTGEKRLTADVKTGTDNTPKLREYHPYRNKWEYEFAHYLTSLRRCRIIANFAYEPDRLVIGIGATYTPDFRVTNHDGSIEYHEVKGYKRVASMVRLRAAALRYPQFQFILVTKSRGQWTHTVVGGRK